MRVGISSPFEQRYAYHCIGLYSFAGRCGKKVSKILHIRNNLDQYVTERIPVENLRYPQDGEKERGKTVDNGGKVVKNRIFPVISRKITVDNCGENCGKIPLTWGERGEKRVTIIGKT